MERQPGVDRYGIAAAYLKADDVPKFSRTLAPPPEATGKRAGGVEDQHFGSARVGDDDSTIREESGALHTVEWNLVPSSVGARGCPDHHFGHGRDLPTLIFAPRGRCAFDDPDGRAVALDN